MDIREYWELILTYLDQPNNQKYYKGYKNVRNLISQRNVNNYLHRVVATD